jgi:DNA mismatch endonuclease (patch repair protein)
MGKAKPFTSDPAEVSNRMRLIRGRNTKPEVALFSILHAAAIPFETHPRIGRMEADAIINGRLLIFVDSPFWHLRDERLLGRLSPHWKARLVRNKQRDARQRRHLRKLGFSVIRIWADEVEERRVLSRIRRVLPIRGQVKR